MPASSAAFFALPSVSAISFSALLHPEGLKVPLLLLKKCLDPLPGRHRLCFVVLKPPRLSQRQYTCNSVKEAVVKGLESINKVVTLPLRVRAGRLRRKLPDIHKPLNDLVQQAQQCL